MKVLKKLTTGFFGGGVLLLCTSGFAQEPTPAKPAPNSADFLIESDQIIVAGPDAEDHVRLPPPESGHAYTFNFIASEMNFDRKVVKGAPYSAEAVTESVQTLADGNRIVRKSSAKVYRDNDGRTRREQTLNAVGPFATAGDVPQLVFINDPVGGVNYSLDQRSRTARKMSPRMWRGGRRGPQSITAVEAPLPPPAGPNMERRRVMIHKEGPDVHFAAGAKSFSKPVEEQLGKQNVEGVEAEGTRTTVTIAAGEIGNERPIEIVSERWYSPELQTVVMSKHSDPLVGETTYRLTNINRAEPGRALFEVPADYKIQEGPKTRIELQPVKKPADLQ